MSVTTRVESLLIVVTGALLLALPGVAAEPAPAPAASSGADAASGRTAFNNQCRTCHSVKEGDNRLGPSLGKIIGAKAGSQSGYPNYSQAMKTAGVVWDAATLERFIGDPEAVVPNNNMKPFKGVPEASVRKAIVEYLKTEAG